jgi:LytS/YehU family sensor histidine kinase
LLVINGTYALLKFLLTIDPPTRSQVIVMNVYGAILFIPAFSIYFSLHFLKSWRRSEVESEKFQKESIRSQLESLKSQIDPHFLFNNLNILSSLIDKDKERSKTFLNKFAEVYRLLLRSRTEDLVTLREELDFIQSYCYLIQTRFDETIRFTFDISPPQKQLMLPPLTLQLLIENAIKHTLITEKKPLWIQIASDAEDTLVVSNNLNEKLPGDAKYSGNGLENIRMRYRHFTSKRIQVEKTHQEFKVTIPLIEAQ